MSQSSNSSMNTNIFSEISSVISDTKITSTATKQGTKRPTTDQHQNETKKVMIDHPSREQQVANVPSKTFDKPKFISASEMIMNSRINVKTIPEIPDDELLDMAIKFEMEHPE